MRLTSAGPTSTRRTRSARLSARGLALVAVTALAVGVLTACSGDDGDGGDGDSPEALADALAAALTTDATPPEDGDDSESPGEQDAALAAIGFTTDASAVAEEYAAVVEGLDETGVTVSVEDVTGEGDTRSATLAWSWAVTEDQAWDYTSEATLEETDEGWAAVWDRSLVEPGLGAEDVLDVTTTNPERGDITGARGAVLVTERPVQRYGIDKTQVKPAAVERSARRLAQLVGIDAASYVKTVKASGDSAFVEAIAYRKGEVPAAVRAGADAIAGVLVVDDTLALAPTKEFAAPILGRVGPVTAEMVAEAPDTYRAGDIAGVSGLQARYDEQLRGTPGRIVTAVRADGNEDELFVADPVAGEDLSTTLDPNLQQRAEELLADVGPASALVAVRPSDGAILVAANGPGTDGQNYATYGQAAPGSTFKIVSTLALLRAGVAPSDTVECPAQVTVDGKAFENYDDYPASSLGQIPLSTAVAQSCNTAFIGQRDQLGKKDLAAAAGSLGLGIDHDLGFPAYFGQVPPAASDTEAAADLIGQGKILASPMVMASVIGSVQDGTTVIPTLLPDHQPDAAAAEPDKLTAAEAGQLRTMLRETVTSGSGAALADVPGSPVIAKTGTAEFELDGAIALHAWMVAAQGDLAVAVYVDEGESGSRTAGPILEEFLRSAR